MFQRYRTVLSRRRTKNRAHDRLRNDRRKWPRERAIFVAYKCTGILRWCHHPAITRLSTLEINRLRILSHVAAQKFEPTFACLLSQPPLISAPRIITLDALKRYVNIIVRMQQCCHDSVHIVRILQRVKNNLAETRQEISKFLRLRIKFMSDLMRPSFRIIDDRDSCGIGARVTLKWNLILDSHIRSIDPTCTCTVSTVKMSSILESRCSW